jgi:hypothetical protein
VTSDDDVMFQGKWIKGEAMKYSQAVCHASVYIDRDLSDIVNGLLTKVKPEHHDVLRYAAGQLDMDEFLDTTARVACGSSSRKQRRRFIDDQTTEAVANLQDYGIIPVAPPWFSLTWFVLKWVIIPFIRQLIEQYVDKQDEKLKA